MRTLAIIMGLACASHALAADVYPGKPIRMIVPFSPGGTSDTLARILGQKMTEQWNQQVVVDFRPGASGIIGTEIAMRAAADGYTLMHGNLAQYGINPSLYSKLPYDTLRDFLPLSLVATAPQLLVVNPSLAAKSVKELIALAQTSPGKLNFGSGGTGTLAFVAGELFKSTAKLDLVHVPYKGAAPAMVDVQAGQVHLMFEGGGLNYLREGKIRVLAVTSARRAMAAPEVPTVAEAALPGFESTIWFGLLAPAATPRAHVDTLSAKLGQVLEQGGLRQKFPALDIARSTPEQFAAHIRAEIPKWRKVIQDANIVIE